MAREYEQWSGGETTASPSLAPEPETRPVMAALDQFGAQLDTLVRKVGLLSKRFDLVLAPLKEVSPGEPDHAVPPCSEVTLRITVSTDRLAALVLQVDDVLNRAEV